MPFSIIYNFCLSQSVYLSACLSVCLPVFLSICLSLSVCHICVCMSLCQFVRLRQSTCLPQSTSYSLFIYLFVSPDLSLPVCLSVSLCLSFSICLLVSLNVCIPVCLSLPFYKSGSVCLSICIWLSLKFWILRLSKCNGRIYDWMYAELTTQSVGQLHIIFIIICMSF